MLLSGGVDPSLVTGLAARNKRRIKTFTVGFKNNPAYDESSYADLVARYFDTDHLLIEADDFTPDIMKLLARQYDEPITDSSMIPTFMVSQEIGEAL